MVSQEALLDVRLMKSEKVHYISPTAGSSLSGHSQRKTWNPALVPPDMVGGEGAPEFPKSSLTCPVTFAEVFIFCTPRILVGPLP